MRSYLDPTSVRSPPRASDQRAVLAQEEVAQSLAGAAHLAGADKRGKAMLREGDLKNVRCKSDASQM